VALDRLKCRSHMPQSETKTTVRGVTMSSRVKPWLYLVALGFLCPEIGVGQAPDPGTRSSQSRAVQKKPAAHGPDTAARSTASKRPAPSAAAELVKHGAHDQSTACNAARTDKSGQLDCGMHGKAAKPNPR
jgi:hypothetical protein